MKRVQIRRPFIIGGLGTLAFHASDMIMTNPAHPRPTHPEVLFLIGVIASGLPEVLEQRRPRAELLSSAVFLCVFVATIWLASNGGTGRWLAIAISALAVLGGVLISPHPKGESEAHTR